MKTYVKRRFFWGMVAAALVATSKSLVASTVIRLHQEKNCTVLRINRLLKAQPPFGAPSSVEGGGWQLNSHSHKSNTPTDRSHHPFQSLPSSSPSIDAFELFADRSVLIGHVRRALEGQGFLTDIPHEDPESAQDDDFSLVFPAIVWLATHDAFLVTVRVFFRDAVSVIFGMLFTHELAPVLTEQRVYGVVLPGVLPIPIPNRTGRYNGPEDARLFVGASGELLSIFNMKDADDRRKMWIFHFDSAQSHPIVVADYFYPVAAGMQAEHSKKGQIRQSQHAPIDVPSAEKNWTPVVVGGGRVQMVYNYRHFQILTCCPTLRVCTKTAGGPFDPAPGGLRGGTPFVRWPESPYFISFAYTHLQAAAPSRETRRRRLFAWLAGDEAAGEEATCAVYKPSLIVIKVASPSPDSPPLQPAAEAPPIELVYASEPLDIFKMARIRKTAALSTVCGVSRIVTIGGLALGPPPPSSKTSSHDAFATVNVGDNKPLLLKLIGLSTLVEKIIKAHRNNWMQSSLACAETLAIPDL